MQKFSHIAAATALALLVLLPAGAGATSFSFGEILATDVIESVIVAPGIQNVSFTESNGQIVIEGFVSTITFVNRGDISLNPGDVQFSSTLTLDGTPTVTASFVNALFSNNAGDFSLVDLAGADGTFTSPILMAEGDYANPLVLTATANTGVLGGTLTAEMGSFSGGDGDFLAAFGTMGELDGLLDFGFGLDLCGVVVTCPFPGVATGLSDYDANPTIKLETNLVPEPSTGSLLALGLIGFAALRRRSAE